MIKTLLASAALLFYSAIAAAQPNIVVVMLDDVPDDMSLLPKVTKSLPGALRFVNSFTHQPLCGPSRATFLTGQEGANNGVTNNGTGFLPSLEGLVPQALQNVGYTNAIFGKKPNGYRGSIADLGFNQWGVITQISERRFEDPVMDINGTSKAFNGYATDVIYDLAERWIEQAQGPYFAWISAVGGHAPNIPAARYKHACDNSPPFNPGPAFYEEDVSDKPSFIRDNPIKKPESAEKSYRKRCATLQADDEWVEKLVRRFAGENTCVFLTSDNGFLHGQHRETGKNYLYEESIRVPLVLWGCGVAAGTDNRLVSNVDLPATILELAGATPGRPLDGRSVFGERRTEVPLLGVWYQNKRDDHQSVGVREVDWAYFDHGNGEEELYDMRTDPRQLNSVHSNPRQRSRLQRFRKSIR